MGILNKLYPDPNELKKHLRSFNDKEKSWFIRLWLSEGIPYYFQDNPLKYEEIRDYISNRLNIHQKEITLIGSARIGISLSPPPKYGNQFSKDSDFDFSIISSELFEQCSEAFLKWNNDYQSGEIKPKNENELKYWKDNSQHVPKNINSGFIDPYKIPNRTEYQPSSTISQLSFDIKKHFELNKAGFRVYNSWDSFIKQCLLNLTSCINKM